MNKVVSAIITTHNRLYLLQRAVESVLSQTYKDIELIIVDDASSDGTKEWCVELEKQSKEKTGHIPVKYIHITPEESKGGNHARNLGIKQSSGDYIAFLDDDDMWLPNKTIDQLRFFDNTNCGVVYGKRITELIQSDGSTKLIENDLIPNMQGDISKEALIRMFTTSSFLMIRKSLLYEVGCFDENLKYWQDYELLIRLAQVTNFGRIDVPVTIYRVNSNDTHRLTNKYYGWHEAVKYILNKHYKLFKNLKISQKLEVKSMILYDAALRCKSSDMIFKSRWFRFLNIITRFYMNLINHQLLNKIIKRIK